MQQYLRSRRQQVFGDHSRDDSYVSAYRLSHENYQAVEEQHNEDVAKIDTKANLNKWRHKRDTSNRTKSARKSKQFVVKEFIKFELADAKQPDEATFMLQQRIRESKNLRQPFEISNSENKNSTNKKRDTDSSIDETRIVKIMHPVNYVQIPGPVHKVMHMVRSHSSNLYKGQENQRYASSEQQPIQYGEKMNRQKRLQYRLLGKGTNYYPQLKYFGQPQTQQLHYQQEYYQPKALPLQPGPSYNFILNPVPVQIPVPVSAPIYVTEAPAPIKEEKAAPQQIIVQPSIEIPYKQPSKNVPQNNNGQSLYIVHPSGPVHSVHSGHQHPQKEAATSYINFNMPEHQQPAQYYQSYQYQRTPFHGYKVQQHPHQDQYLYQEQQREEIPAYKIEELPKMPVHYKAPQSYVTQKPPTVDYASNQYGEEQKNLEELSSLIGKNPYFQLKGLNQILFKDFNSQTPQENTAPVLFHPATEVVQEEKKSEIKFSQPINTSPDTQDYQQYTNEHQPTHSQNQNPISEAPVKYNSNHVISNQHHEQVKATTQSPIDDSKEDNVSNMKIPLINKNYMFKKKTKLTKKSKNINKMTKFESQKVLQKLEEKNTEEVQATNQTDTHRVSKRSIYGVGMNYPQMQFQPSIAIPTIVSPYHNFPVHSFEHTHPITHLPVSTQLYPLNKHETPSIQTSYYQVIHVPAFRKMPESKPKHKSFSKKKYIDRLVYRLPMKYRLKMLRKHYIASDLEAKIKAFNNVKKIIDLNKIFY
jgi:hypothetical protein